MCPRNWAKPNTTKRWVPGLVLDLAPSRRVLQTDRAPVDTCRMKAPLSATHSKRPSSGVALVLEDDATLQAVLVETLREEGLKHRACHSYAELRAAAAQAGVR